MRRLALVATLVALGAELLHALIGFGGPRVDAFMSNSFYSAIEVVGVLACVARAIRRPEHRAAWWFVAAGLACWAFGDIAWLALPQPMPYPSIADAFYLAFYPLCIAGMALLLASGRDRIAARLWVDGLIAGLAVAAATIALSFDAIVDATHGTTTQTAVNLAYPLADLVLVGFVLTAFATQAWRPGRGWTLLGIGVALTAVADTIYLYQDAIGTFRDGSWVDVMWPAALLCCGWAAWESWLQKPTAQRYTRQTFALPTLFAALAIGVLCYGQVVDIPSLASVLATAALLTASVRASWTFRENVQLLDHARREALTDGLTGLPNRRSLMHDLDRAVAAGARGDASTFAFFDLDGFKGYNDTFGHAAGDMLLNRLAGRLAEVAAVRGRAYRLGGDEFCVLLAGRVGTEDDLLEQCRQALHEQGEGFRVGASCGAVTIPDEADGATHALQLADQRMYAAKDEARSSSRTQMRDMLLQVLAEREPELHRHLQGVASLAVAVGRRLDLTTEQLDEVARAAELHDVGKIAIPDEVLHKPGPLDEGEWALMRQHTIIGDRILAAAPSMRPVAAIVRASHERWDGEGYPDKLAGDAIPPGARIVAVCDAFHAMTSPRPYQPAMEVEEALAELRRCAGTQFDPAVIEVFVELVRSRTDGIETVPTSALRS